MCFWFVLVPGVLIAAGIMIAVQKYQDHQDETCNYENDPHITCCQDIEQPLIVVGDSVKINEKVFTPEEVELLKTEHEFNGESTFAILERLTQKTLNCEYEIASFEWNAPNTWTG